jgi:hypothetical protein
MFVTYHAAEMEPLDGAVLIVTANHLAIGNLQGGLLSSFPVIICLAKNAITVPVHVQTQI